MIIAGIPLAGAFMGALVGLMVGFIGLFALFTLPFVATAGLLGAIVGALLGGFIMNLAGPVRRDRMELAELRSGRPWGDSVG